MTIRGVFLADGSSDRPLAGLLERVCADFGADVSLTAVDADLLRGAGLTVQGRFEQLIRRGVSFDIAFVHRDAEGASPHSRRREVRVGAEAASVQCPVVPVVPVRMMEAWLLLDESAIREVAGRPRGRTPLNLPRADAIERLSDPKTRLSEALLAACAIEGQRRRRDFKRDFGRHRALLLERLDASGGLPGLPAWQQLVSDTQVALDAL